MPTLSRVHDFVLRVEGLLDSRRAVAWSVILLILQCATMAFLVAGVHGLIVKFDKPTGTDFTSFYAAGSLADEGNPGAAYNQLDHYAAEERVAAPGIEYIYYYYPPVFLLLCAGLARLPYIVAFLLFEIATLALFALAVRRIVGVRHRSVLMPIIAFPAVFWNFGMGQNAFLSAGLFALATLQLQLRRPLLAGLLFGALCFKPHLGLLIPVALAGGRHWRAAAAAACSVAVLASLSVAAFGWGTWHEFLVSLAVSPDAYQSGRIGFHLMVNVFGAAQLLGLPPGASSAMQAVASLAMAALVLTTWRRDGRLSTQCAVLLAATVIAAPAVLWYDLMLLAVAMAWLVRDGRATGFLPFEKLVLTASLTLIFLARTETEITHLPLGLMAAVLVLGLALRRGHAEGRRVPERFSARIGARVDIWRPA